MLRKYSDSMSLFLLCFFVLFCFFKQVKAYFQSRKLLISLESKSIT